MKTFNILLVEDNQGDILLTKEAFEESNNECELFVVNDGQQAINFLEQISPFSNTEAPNLILLDINLPKINGHEVLKYIKSSSSLKSIPVIMLTTSSSQKDITECYKNYANCFITKPNEVDEFFKIIQNVNSLWLKNINLV